MSKKNISSLVHDIATPIADKLSLDIWDVVFEKEGAYWFLRVFITKKDGGSVSTVDCENLSKQLSLTLDKLDPIENSYYLDVSSVGLGRKLKNEEQLKSVLGKSITVKLIRPIDGKREFSGILKQVADKSFYMQDLSFKIEIKKCSYIKLDDDINLF